MSGTVRQLKRRPAKRPAPRTVTVTGKGDFAEWEATVRVDFPAALLEEFESGVVMRIIKALDSLVVSHNMPGSSGEIAATLMEVDPYGGLLEISNAIAEAITNLPNR